MQSLGGFTYPFLQIHVCDEQELTGFTPFSSEEAHLAVQQLCEELKQKLSSTETEKENQHLTMTAEIDDLNRTKTNLEERLIELIKYDLSLF